MIKRVRKRYEAARSALPHIELRLGAALRSKLKEGYTGKDLQADLMAGIVVGIIALPLSMALAIASGVPPQHGLYTAIVGGATTALLGGSRTQVSGPTAAFVVILVPISEKFGLGGLLVATLLAGGMLILLGIAKLGRLIQYIPYPVTTGFTTGIAVVIATLQLKDFLGLQIAHMPDGYLDKVATLARALPTLSPADLAVGGLTLAILLLWPRVTRRVPAPLFALSVVSIGAYLFHRLWPEIAVATIGSRFSYTLKGLTQPGIPPLPPLPVLPWTLPGPNGQPLELSVEMVQKLLPAAFAIAMLGAIESLLSAVVSDGMAGTKHDPDAELIGQGAANILSPFFAGFASTGAIARTATNIRSGAKSPLAAVVHALFVLLAVLLLAPLLSYLPMASLAALLLTVAWNMSEIKHFAHVAKVAPKSDVIVLASCFLFTVFFDMVVAVTAGVMLASLLFMRRMAEISGSKLIGKEPGDLREPLPNGVVLYEIAGPLFFGAAQKAMSSLETVAGTAPVVILNLQAVPVIDATGLVNLESTLARLRQNRALVILVGLQNQPRHVLKRASIAEEVDLLAFCTSLDAAISLSRTFCAEQSAKRTGTAGPP